MGVGQKKGFCTDPVYNAACPKRTQQEALDSPPRWGRPEKQGHECCPLSPILSDSRASSNFLGDVSKTLRFRKNRGDLPSGEAISTKTVKRALTNPQGGDLPILNLQTSTWGRRAKGRDPKLIRKACGVIRTVPTEWKGGAIHY